MLSRFNIDKKNSMQFFGIAESWVDLVCKRFWQFENHFLSSSIEYKLNELNFSFHVFLLFCIILKFIQSCHNMIKKNSAFFWWPQNITHFLLALSVEKYTTNKTIKTTITNAIEPVNSLCKNILLIFTNFLYFPCLEKWTSAVAILLLIYAHVNICW